MSSPMELSSPPAPRSKERRNPSITPRRFGRFFSPRLSSSSSTRRPLRLSNSSTVNARSSILSSDPIEPSDIEESADENDSLGSRKRRRIEGRPLGRRLFQEHGSTYESDASERGQTVQRSSPVLDDFYRSVRPGVRPPSSKTEAVETEPCLPPIHRPPPKRIIRLSSAPLAPNLLTREHGFHPTRHTPACDHRAATASFYSTKDDFHSSESFEEPGGVTIPFSLAPANKSRIVVLGDEQGFIRILRTRHMNGTPAAVARVHNNAIMSMHFTADDEKLATACGDRSAKILDVRSSRVLHELGGGHMDSLRQVTFQPGQTQNVLSTSDRVGGVRIWDLRASAKSVNSLTDTHLRSKGATPSSVTAIQWLPTGREHLLLTGSEGDCTIKLWDTRYIKRRRQDVDVPVASTRPPSTHKAGRSWGITSLTLGTDATRCYAVCKDSAVYAYSVAHLLTGIAPELTPNAWKRKPSDKSGLGPLYGFKHDAFRVNSFYVRAAIRPATVGEGGSELLAVGSSEGGPVLFPTDERYHNAAWNRHMHHHPSEKPESSVPISRVGTPLIQGHEREVTGVAWTMDGDLVTSSDDFRIRRWTQGERARYLRQVGWFGGERFQAGWADVAEDWDEDDD